MRDGAPALVRRLVAPAALAALVIAAYAPSLRGGFLNYDDPWLIEHNPVLADHRPSALLRIWTAFDESTRLALGAEYLPVRDSSHWWELKLAGPNPHVMRATNLALYVVAVWLLRAYLARLLGAGLVAEAAAWLFALHPVHAESVAWVAGRKDVLALAFAAAALLVHAAGARRLRTTVAVLALVAAAGLSKAVAVVVPGLLLVHDLVVRRKPDWRRLAAAAAVTIPIIAVQIRVGALVGMVGAPIGGDRMIAAASMGPVWLRYLRHAFAPYDLSVVYDVPVRSTYDERAWLGWLVLLGWAILAALAWRRGRRLFALAFAWFALGLAPTSQVIVPLQNAMADRYLLFAVLGPCVLIAAAVVAVGAIGEKRAGDGAQRRASKFPVALALWRATGGVVAAAVLGFVVAGYTAATAVRAEKFTDPVALWLDAWVKTHVSPAPAYQLGQALVERGDDRRAEVAFRDALVRSADRGEVGRRSTNNLAALLVRGGRLDQAEILLRSGRGHYPNDPKMLANLAEVAARRGKQAEAQELRGELERRFPAYVSRTRAASPPADSR